jgi:hypothetical protein
MASVVRAVIDIAFDSCVAQTATSSNLQTLKMSPASNC